MALHGHKLNVFPIRLFNVMCLLTWRLYACTALICNSEPAKCVWCTECGKSAHNTATLYRPLRFEFGPGEWEACQRGRCLIHPGAAVLCGHYRHPHGRSSDDFALFSPLMQYPGSSGAPRAGDSVAFCVLTPLRHHGKGLVTEVRRWFRVTQVRHCWACERSCWVCLHRPIPQEADAFWIMYGILHLVCKANIFEYFAVCVC